MWCNARKGLDTRGAAPAFSRQLTLSRIPESDVDRTAGLCNRRWWRYRVQLNSRQCFGPGGQE